MDTNLKKDKILKTEKTYKTEKQIRAFIYRVLFMGSLFLFLASAIIGRNTISMAATYGLETALSGKFYIYPEFKELVDTLLYKAMIHYAGAGDADGYPVTDDNVALIISKYGQDFKQEMVKGGNDILYYIKTPTGTHDNTSYRPLFSSQTGELLIPDGYRLCYYWNGPADTLSGVHWSLTLADAPLTDFLVSGIDMPYEPIRENAQNIRIAIAVRTDTKTYTHPILQTLYYKAKSNQAILPVCIVSATCTLLFGVLCLFSRNAGRAARISYGHLTGKLFFECKLLCLIILGYCFYRYAGHLLYFGTVLPEYVLPPIALFFPTGCLLYLAYADCKQNGAKIFIQSLLVKAFLYVKEYIVALPWYRKAMTVCTALMAGSVLCILTGAYMISLNLVVFTYSANGIIRRNELEIIRYALGDLLLVAGLFLFIMYIRARRFAKDTKAVTEKISAMQAGKETELLSFPRRSLLYVTALELNTLENGIEAAIEQRNRSNKMRVELITNVSHDLKTPLTSIINYADLLCEEDLPPTASEYAKALQKKAYRLKTMVQDVFELSKATSGNLPVEKHTLDLVRLLKQTLADMEERIQESTLTFKTNIPDMPVWVDADGDRLYRVFQNLFINALQYSLENSRVHVILSLEEKNVCVKVKNTSKQELNFDTLEITERFVRADTSRTSEGSGLGLSIAQSFTEACGGTFHIETDADMFIACVQLPIADTAPDAAIPLETIPAADAGAVSDTAPQNADLSE
ncbi:MAG: HAMP domain-containing histidine kinase [Lachnospiraceae bacterium]|nr:HAMP domain-containing histidine kinase [Lachnospiraceae bacterium]